MGELLRATRQRRNLSLAEVAAATRIKPAYLEALEDSEYSVLPGAAYITGFIRNYARFLGLHPDEVLEEFYAFRPPPAPVVKPATRVLAGVHTRRLRKRFVWTLLSVVVLLACGFAIRQYNAAYDHSYAAAPPHLTPQNLGASLTKARIITRSAGTARTLVLHLRATSPVWVRVTADGKRTFQGLLHQHGRSWVAHTSIYVMTYDGTRVKAVRNGTRLGAIARRPGLGVWSATPAGWKRIS